MLKTIFKIVNAVVMPVILLAIPFWIFLKMGIRPLVAAVILLLAITVFRLILLLIRSCITVSFALILILILLICI